MDADGRAKVPCRDQPTDEANVAAQDASAGTPSPEPEGHPPSSESIRDYLVYGLSLPERAIRSTAGVVGGALRESAAALIPQTFRNARTYQLFVGQMLDFLAEDVRWRRPSAPTGRPAGRELRRAQDRRQLRRNGESRDGPRVAHAAARHRQRPCVRIQPNDSSTVEPRHRRSARPAAGSGRQSRARETRPRGHPHTQQIE